MGVNNSGQNLNQAYLQSMPTVPKNIDGLKPAEIKPAEQEPNQPNIADIQDIIGQQDPSIFDQGSLQEIPREAALNMLQKMHEQAGANELLEAMDSLGVGDEFGKKSHDSINEAKEGAFDKSIYDNEDDFTDSYEQQILGDKDEITNEEFIQSAIENGFLSEEDAAGFEALIDKNGEGKLSREEVRVMLRAAYNAANEIPEKPYITELSNTSVTEY